MSRAKAAAAKKRLQARISRCPQKNLKKYWLKGLTAPAPMPKMRAILQQTTHSEVSCKSQG